MRTFNKGWARSVRAISYMETRSSWWFPERFRAKGTVFYSPNQEADHWEASVGETRGTVLIPSWVSVLWSIKCSLAPESMSIGRVKDCPPHTRVPFSKLLGRDEQVVRLGRVLPTNASPFTGHKGQAERKWPTWPEHRATLGVETCCLSSGERQACQAAFSFWNRLERRDCQNKEQGAKSII